MRVLALSLLLAAATTANAIAGPPFLTDDPEPVPFGHYELYAFVAAAKNAGISTTTNGPAIEFNYGPVRNVQLSFSLPYTYLSVPSTPAVGAPGIPGTTVSGFGDTELAVKFRFVQETAGRPQIAIFPSVTLPTGSASNGIGNGRAWYRFPLWMQKSWGPWTTYGGGGYAIDSAPGAVNFPFGGLVLQRDFSPRVTLGGEIYSQGAQFTGDKWSTFYNIGGYVAPVENFQLLFTLGHTISGDNQAIFYFGLRWTGPIKKAARPA